MSLPASATKIEPLHPSITHICHSFDKQACTPSENQGLSYCRNCHSLSTKDHFSLYFSRDAISKSKQLQFPLPLLWSRTERLSKPQHNSTLLYIYTLISPDLGLCIFRETLGDMVTAFLLRKSFLECQFLLRAGCRRKRPSPGKAFKMAFSAQQHVWEAGALFRVSLCTRFLCFFYWEEDKK